MVESSIGPRQTLPRNVRRAPVKLLSVLIDRIAAGEQDALAEFHDLTVAKLYSLAVLIVRDSQDAEEVVCDTVAQVWRTARQYDPLRGSVLAWLLNICRSRAVDLLRHNRATSPTGAPGSGDASEIGPDDLLRALQADRDISRALARLSPLRLRLVSLAFFQGLTHGEIARETSLPGGTVKSHIRRALAAMRAELGGRGDGARSE